ncbi:hypothetical protein ADJ80_10095 [Aggregatibacter aphrophilus]|mgnify:FL=1|uniref:Chalcone isomerase domain-containing protein n=1 Tax=Aggregatibacter aphrophilus TaxID=732 RepID=A0ABX9VT34_AGGAP|nr:hypothetical protein [Aggregatibacter aphrophilus]AKU64069.1 hypothetical protein ADJ80_10095 [Aggregatibacter aphrophilus]RMW80910.1 hypothetical protein DOL88_08990 [Aggregatibacter aphrophilus]
MKLKSLLFILSLLPTALSAQWVNVGNADYNWGPFLVYSINLATENGEYKENQLPMMLSFKYEKPVEGKNFAISLIKEMEHLKADKTKMDLWLKAMQEIFPDFSPNAVLSYIALPDKGYFILNDSILDHEFEPEFSQMLINIWLSPESNFIKLQPQLLGKEKGSTSPDEFKTQPEVDPMGEDDASPQLPPNFPLNTLDPEAGG